MYYTNKFISGLQVNMQQKLFDNVTIYLICFKLKLSHHYNKLAQIGLSVTIAFLKGFLLNK